MVSKLTLLIMKTADAIKHFGGIPELAGALGITRHAIYQWGEDVPRSRQYEIQQKSGGALCVDASGVESESGAAS